MAPVGSYPEGRSPFGALDLSGNVQEWVADGYGPYPSVPSDSGGEDALPERVVRGGSWRTAARSCRTTYRSGFGPDSRRPDLGFRFHGFKLSNPRTLAMIIRDFRRLPEVIEAQKHRRRERDRLRK